jgi:hypothetical protein
LAKESIKQGLSLLTLAVKEKRQGMISTIILCDQDIAKEDLPSLLRQSIIFKPDKPGLGAKITAKANLPDKRKINEEYRLNCYALPKVGLWLEVGPYEVDWNGILFGVSGAGIEAMGVGKMGEIPEKSVLKYPIRDMHLSLGGNKYTAWGSQNVLSREDSAYFKVKGTPDSLVFGAFEPENNNPELFKFSLI